MLVLMEKTKIIFFCLTGYFGFSAYLMLSDLLLPFATKVDSRSMASTEYYVRYYFIKGLINPIGIKILSSETLVCIRLFAYVSMFSSKPFSIIRS